MKVTLTTLCACLALALVPAPAAPGVGASAAVQRPFDVKWIHGSADCGTNTDPPLQVYRFDDDTYILRQSKCLDYEAPFMYLLIGRNKALLLDSGAKTRDGKALPMRETVERILAEHSAARRRARPPQLIVAHSHAHGDHVQGDRQFDDPARATVVGTSLEEVKSFFRFVNWPTRAATFDLGGRALTVIPIPGHEDTHIAVYDPKTKILLTGDTLYPGILVVNHWRHYRQSINRLANFAARNQVSYILGAHVEMTSRPRVEYPYRTVYQPDEHVLQLGTSHLLELRDACEAMGNNPRHEVHADFIIAPAPGSAQQ